MGFTPPGPVEANGEGGKDHVRAAGKARRGMTDDDTHTRHAVRTNSPL